MYNLQFEKYASARLLSERSESAFVGKIQMGGNPSHTMGPVFNARDSMRDLHLCTNYSVSYFTS